MHGLALAAILMTGSAAAAPAPAPLLEFQVMVPNLTPQDRVVVTLYNDPAAWKSDGKPFATTVATVEEGVGRVRFRAPAGEYAVAAFNDRNGDGRLGTFWFGWPTEPVGYSGGRRPLLGRPDWASADFAITPDQRTTVFVRLK